MLLPGLRKLKNQYGFESKSDRIYGFHKDCFIQILECQGKKVLYIDFPVKLDAEDWAKVESWHRKGYATELERFDGEDDLGSIHMDFREAFLPFKVAKIAEIIDDLTNHIANKYPDAHNRCQGNGCTHQHEETVKVYEMDGVLLPLCSECAKEVAADFEQANADFNEQPNNYEQGALLAAVFSIPGLLFPVIMYALGRLSSLAGIVFFYLAMKGYLWAKGKMDRVGVCIIALISLAFSALGTYIGFLSQVVKELGDLERFAEAPMSDKIGCAIELLDDPEVHASLMKDLTTTLILCVVSIAIVGYPFFKSAGKSSIKEA